MNDVKTRISIAIKKAKVTQGGLGKAMGTSRAAVSAMLNSPGDPPTRYVETTARLTGYSMDWLLYGSEKAEEPEVPYGLIKDPLIKLMLDKLNDQEKRLKEMEAVKEKFLADIEKIATERAKEMLAAEKKNASK